MSIWKSWIETPVGRVRVLMLCGAMAFAAGYALNVTGACAQPANWRAEFWGAELPFPPDATYLDVSDLYLSNDDDLTVLIVYAPSTPERFGSPYTRIFAAYSASQRKIEREFIFTPSTRTQTNQELASYLAGRRRLRRILDYDHISLADGTRIAIDSNSAVNRCSIPYNYYLKRQDASGKQIAAKMVITLRPDRSPYPYWSDCELGNHSEDVIRIHGRALTPSRFDLEDGTWLLDDTGFARLGLGPPSVIRFRGFLESPYLQQRRDLLVVDNDEIHRLFWEEGVNRAPTNAVPIEYGDQVVFEHYRQRLGGPTGGNR